MDRLTSPLSKMHQKLDPVPPVQFFLQKNCYKKKLKKLSNVEIRRVAFSPQVAELVPDKKQHRLSQTKNIFLQTKPI